MTQDALDDDAGGEGFRPPLTRQEQAVFDAIGERSGVHADAYRRMIEMARSGEGDQLAVVLVGHLARELMNSLPRISTDIPRPKRVDYIGSIGRVAQAWPPDATGVRGVPSAAAIDELASLVADHERSVSRRHQAADLVTATDPAGRRTVPAPGLGQWQRLLGDAVALAHSLMREPGQPMPAPADARAVADELTATLHAIFAPFYESMAALDELLGRETIGAPDAADAAALLKTFAQFDYFFARASHLWLEPLAQSGFFREPPTLEDAGGGYVRMPGWPEGDYLARMAGVTPDRVAAISRSVPLRDNPRVGLSLIRIALELPPAAGASLAPQIAEWVAVRLSADLLTRDCLTLAVRLAQAGEVQAGFQLYEAAIGAAASRADEGDDSHLQECLGESLDSLLAVDAPRAASILQRRLEAALLLIGESADYTGIWMPRVDRVPRYGSDRPGRIANALYRALLQVDGGAAGGAASSFVRRPERILNRIGLALMADHPGCVGAIDYVLAEPSRWDRSDARYEFRRLLRTRFSDAEDATKTSILEYAELASEVDDGIVRSGVSFSEEERALHKRRWRTRLLGATWQDVPDEWQRRLGPLVEGEAFVEEVREPEARFVPDSAHDSEELGGIAPPDLVRFVCEWSGSGENPFETRAGLARVAAEVLLTDLERHLPFLEEWASCEPTVVAVIARELGSGMRAHEAIQLGSVGPFLSRATGSLAHPGDRTSDEVEAIRWLAWLVEHLARENRLKATAGEIDRIVQDLRILVENTSDESPDATARDPEELALSSTVGTVVQAVAQVASKLDEDGHVVAATTIVAYLAAARERWRSPACRAAFGLALPLVLTADPDRADAWVEAVLGEEIPDGDWRPAMRSYVVGWHYDPVRGRRLVAAYERALPTMQALMRDPASRDPWIESLGAHALLADLWGPDQAREHGWVRQWFEAAPEAERASLVRLVAQFAAENPVASTRARAREMLRWRLGILEADGSQAELRAVGWVSSATDQSGAVLSEVLLPALTYARGATDNGPGVVRLIASEAAALPEEAVAALRLVVDGDEHGSLCQLAEADLARGLTILLQNPATSVRAARIIHDLGARGCTQFRPLLDQRNVGGGGET